MSIRRVGGVVVGVGVLWQERDVGVGRLRGRFLWSRFGWRSLLGGKL